MIVAVIPAKKDSSRLPNKNMQLLNGKPMIHYSLKLAQASQYVEKIYVSTDSDEIAAYAKKNNVDVIMRGKELGGETPIVEVYLDALKVLDDSSIKYIVGLQPDHPDRRIKLDEAIAYLIEKDSDELISVDGEGLVNGSLKIMKTEALLAGRIGAISTIMDDCTNIHYMDDLKRAESKLVMMESQ